MFYLVLLFYLDESQFHCSTQVELSSTALPRWNLGTKNKEQILHYVVLFYSLWCLKFIYLFILPSRYLPTYLEHRSRMNHYLWGIASPFNKNQVVLVFQSISKSCCKTTQLLFHYAQHPSIEELHCFITVNYCFHFLLFLCAHLCDCLRPVR